jgi:hypothetical protein
MSQDFVLHANDKLRPGVLRNLIDFINRLPANKSWRIGVAQYRKTRSNEQNAALWGVAYPVLAEATGQPVNDWHDYMLGEHFGWVEYSLFGRRKLRPARTTTTGYNGEDDVLSTAEFAEFYDFIQQRAAENGIFVPDPDPFWREHKEAELAIEAASA